MLLAALIGGLFVYWRLHARLTSTQTALTKTESELEAERRLSQERQLTIEQTKQQLSDSFAALARDALKHNSGEFLKLAEQNLQLHQHKAQQALSEREKAVENLVKPIKEALTKTEQQIQQIEKDRHAAFGSLTKHLETMAESHRLLQTETRNLVQALRRPEVRGQWGEMTLKRLAELAGMVEHCDFFEQESVSTADGLLRPDMIVRMPDKREIIVDAKTSLDAYLSAIEAADDTARAQAMQRHARKVRERVKELAAKSYWQQFNAPDFVVLFIPGDQFLSAALDVDKTLLEDALSEKVILATPTSLVALLRAVAYGWRQETLAENAEKIRGAGQELYTRLTTFSEHLNKTGRSLDSAVSSFNKAVGSFDSRVLPSAKRFTELGLTVKKEVTEPDQIEHAVREVATPENES